MTCADTTLWPEALWSLWAKSGEEGEWLSIPQHMIDSAEIAGLLWEDWVSDLFREFLAKETGLHQQDLTVLVKWLAGGHDLGKIDSAFISQLAEQRDYSWLVDQAREAGLDFQKKPDSGRIPHSHISDILVSHYLHTHAGLSLRSAWTYSSIAGSHHGLPMADTERVRAEHHVNWLSDSWKALQQGALRALAAHTGFDRLTTVLPNRLSSPAQMLLTGLVIMTDWIASNTEVCPLSRSGRSHHANRAVEAVSLIDPTLPWNAKPPKTTSHRKIYQQRFNWPATRDPRPMQEVGLELVQELPENSGGLLVIEAPMGQGKTEAALLCAEFFAEKNGAGGLAVATPTMATADGLLQRVSAWAREAMTSEGDVASLFLAHSKSHLNNHYREMKFHGISESSGSPRLRG